MILTNARVVTPQDDFIGSVVIQEGLITDVIKGDRVYEEGINLHGDWLIPGMIDIHSDYIEKEIRPRPSAQFPFEFAIHFMDARAASCGITTLFSAISFSDDMWKTRTFDDGIQIAEVLNKVSKDSLVRHYTHARLDPNTDGVFPHIEKMQDIESLYLIVYNENIPGQRQFRLEDLIEKRAASEGISMEAAKKILEEKIARTSKVNNRSAIMEAFQHKCILGSHDDTTTLHVDEALQFGAGLSEMPTTMEAAKRAKELAMWVCMGAPNYYRGGSHCGNLSAVDAIDEGLVDILCSDYHFPAMLASVQKLIVNGMPASEAVNMVTLNPARMLQFDDRIGSIEVGKVADLVAFINKSSYAAVKMVLVNGEPCYSADYTQKLERFEKKDLELA